MAATGLRYRTKNALTGNAEDDLKRTRARKYSSLRNALEIRAITPREHAAEREIILEALLPSNPFYRMDPAPVPKDILEGATALRRVEMLKNLKLISDAEEKK